MKRLISIIILFVFTISMTGCATTGQNGQPSASDSAGMGALLGGAVIGFLSTGELKGAVAGAAIGAAAGALTGFVIGKSREKQYKTAEQIYKEKPQLTAKSAKNNPPSVSAMNPIIFNKKGKRVGGINNGEWVELGIDYQIDIPKYSETRQVEVIEYNTLIAPDGKTRMQNPELRRTTIRPCGAVESAIQVEIPPKLPEGKYTHFASVTIGNKEYKKETKVQIVKLNGEMKIYALNGSN